jgi:prepilin-type N-terminal cleavage/methylation domain-containing protein
VNKNYRKIAGVTLIEMLIGIVVSSIIMAAMYTSYTVVNNSYSQVSDLASISRSGRDVVAMLMRDIRIINHSIRGIHCCHYNR